MSKEAMKLALEALEPLVRRAAPWGELDWLNGCKAISALREALAEQPAQQGCMRCNTPKKCALYGCSPLTWPSEKPAQQEQWDAIPDAFNEWWNADYDDTGNPYRKDSPAYWAWSGWKTASKQPERIQLTVRDFVVTVGDIEDAVGTPMYWAEWPNREQP